MTTDTTTTTSTELLVQAGTLAHAAATRVAEALPSIHPLTVTEPQTGHSQVAVGFAAAICADVVGRPGRIGMLLSPELLGELTNGPVTGQGLAAVLQIAVDAAAQALGVTTGAVAELAPAELAAVLSPEFLVVPLVGTGGTAALVLDSLWTLGEPAASPEEQVVATFEPVAADPEAVVHHPVSTPPAPPAPPAPQHPSTPMRGIELLAGVDMELTVELGRTRLPVRNLLALTPGDVLELDRAAGSPADLLVNGQLIARGEVVVVDEDFGLRITEILETNAS